MTLTLPGSARVRPSGRSLIAVGAVVLAAAGPAVAQSTNFIQSEERRPIRIRVGPSGYTAPPPAARETLEQKIARRDRNFLFRSICRGCLPADAEARVFGASRSTIEGEARRVAPDWTEIAAGTEPAIRAEPAEAAGPIDQGTAAR